MYVSNESNFDVFFDNLQVIHKPGPLLEETHYYPFGLTMAGISSKAAGGLENKKKYNGIEFDSDLDINTYEAFYRNLDPQIGRWWQIDPMCEPKVDPNEPGLESLTPYNSMANDPVRFSDPLGDMPGTDDEDATPRKSLFNPPTSETVNKYPAIALLQEVGYLGWNLLGGASVENFVYDRMDGKNSVKEITVGLAEVGIATTKGEGPMPKVKSYGKLKIEAKDAHHVIQDAAVKEIPGYSKESAPATKLDGPSTQKGTPHHAATQAQRTTPLKGGTYGRERVIAYKALVAAGLPKSAAKLVVQAADKYFASIGVNMNTPTRIPANRTTQ